MAGTFRYKIGQDYSANGSGNVVNLSGQSFSILADSATTELGAGNIVFFTSLVLIQINSANSFTAGYDSTATDLLNPANTGLLLDWSGETVPARLIGGSLGDALMGGLAGDTLAGGNGNDTLTGGGGDDTLTGGVGDDMLDGGAGTADIAVFSGNFSDYTFSTFAADSSWTITDKRAGQDGADKILNIEKLQFADGSVSNEAVSLTVTTTDDIVNPFDGKTSLREAINYANANAGTDTITFDANLASAVFTLSSMLPVINSDMTIDGGAGGVTIDGQDLHRIFFINSGTVTLKNLTLEDGLAQGGHGGAATDSGGGGMGAGGAIFIRGSLGGHAAPTVTLDGVEITSSRAIGGNGGEVSGVGGVHGGGGGGLGGNGGSGTIGAGGGHGGGGAFSGETGGQSTNTTGAGGGGANGGAGGANNTNGGAGGAFSGGGGGGGGQTTGGAGGFGGGGGGSGNGFTSSFGGAGGFGGGGGGSTGNSAGSGGYGGGSGGGNQSGVTSGFGGGVGSSELFGFGGGGAGMGGGVFVMAGASVTITGSLNVTGGSVTGGTGPGLAIDGQAFGTGLFLHGSGTLSFSPDAGDTQTVADAIQDESGVVAGGYTAPTGFTRGSWGLTKSGDGTLLLSGSNAYTGTTTVDAGTLQVDGTITSAVTVNAGGTLGGTGTVGVVTVNSGGIVGPGASPGILNSGDFSLGAGSTLAIQLGGTTVGTQYDQVNVTGSVTLGGALSLELINSFDPAFGNTFTIINNDGADAVNGTFAGIAEGATVILGTETFKVTYQGGDGNDVVVTAGEAASLIVTTSLDVVDALDGKTSLREAIAYANSKANVDANTPDVVTFDASVFTGGAASLIRMTLGEIVITDAVKIDGSTGTGVTITGDKNDDDVTLAGTDITDVKASFGGTAGAADDLLDDNSRIFNITSSIAETTLDSLTLTGGRTTAVNAFGGAVSSLADLTIIDSTVSGNATAGSGAVGGGIHSFRSVLLTNSTVSGNATTGSSATGGGVAAGSTTLINSTVSFNVTTGSDAGAGGIFSSQVELTNSTVSGNSTTGANSDVGGIYAFGFITLTNSVVLGNKSVQTTPDVYGGGITYNGLNIVGTGNDTNGSDGVINADPTKVFAQTVDLGGGVLAGVLADNGGPVQTVALKLDASNPALDAATGTTPDTDARGQSRVDVPFIGNIGVAADLGAFEAKDRYEVKIVQLVTSIAETASTATAIKVADVSIVDPEGNNVPSLAGPFAALFELRNDGIYLKAGTVLNFETDPSFNYELSLSTFDDGTYSITGDYITITDVNEAPTAVTLSNAVTTLAENTSTGSLLKIADIAVTDDALGSETITLAGADSSLFEIFDGDLYLKAGATLDFETNPSLDVTVNVDDPTVGGAIDATRSLSVTVTDVNEAPTAVAASNAITSLAEDASTAGARKIADIVITDDALGSETITLSGADAARFEVVAGALFLKAGALLDFETNPVLDVTINVNDPTVGAAVDASTSLSVTVTDVNEAPTALAFSNTLASIAENASTAARRKIADITVTDDALGTETITLTGTDASKFEIFDGDLYLKAGATLDFETNPKLDVTVNVDDTTLGSGIELSRALSVTVTDALETISGSSGSNTLTGTSGADRINAGAGNDTVSGGAGDDIIYGGAGVDRLTGGTGRDTFVFKSITESGYRASGSLTEGGPLTDQAAIGQRDIITDFTPGFDKIDLSDIDANTNLSGNQAFTFRGTGGLSSAGSLVYRKFDNAGTANDRTIIFADVTGDGRSDFQIELTGLKTLGASDFVL